MVTVHQQIQLAIFIQTYLVSHLHSIVFLEPIVKPVHQMFIFCFESIYVLNIHLRLIILVFILSLDNHFVILHIQTTKFAFEIVFFRMYEFEVLLYPSMF